MTAANRVAAEVFEDLEPPFQHPIRHGRAETSGIVMQANTLQFRRHAVEQKPAAGVERRGADAEWRDAIVNGLAIDANDGVRKV